MKRFISAGALVLSVMLVASSSYAETQSYSGTYTGALAGAGLWVSTGEPEVGDFGGYSFVGTEGVPLSVNIADATEGDIAWSVAQDLDGDLTAGEVGEPSVAGCGKGGSLDGSAVAFQEGFAITVFLRSAARVNRNTLEVFPCPGAATHGTITLTTEL